MIRPLASVINSKAHLAVFYDIFSDRLKALDLTVLLMNMFDTCLEGALPLLANQFHVMGVEGWKFCTTTAQKRDLIKSSIAVHKIKGTPYSIKRALEIVGFPGAYFQEGVDRYYNGEINYDGTNTYGSAGWANFRAFVPVEHGITTEFNDPISTELAEGINMEGIEGVPDEWIVLITAVINEYKPLRCRLTEVVFV